MNEQNSGSGGLTRRRDQILKKWEHAISLEAQAREIRKSLQVELLELEIDARTLAKKHGTAPWEAGCVFSEHLDRALEARRYGGGDSDAG